MLSGLAIGPAARRLRPRRRRGLGTTATRWSAATEFGGPGGVHNAGRWDLDDNQGLGDREPNCSSQGS